jgi:beta-xylosidase
MTFQNPVYHDYLADPFCFRHGDWYYAVGTGRAECYSPKFTGPVVPMAKSRDLQHWEPVGRVLELPAEPFTCFWAPEIAEHASQFYMYYHPCLPGKGYHIRVAVADQPDGPYRDSGRALTDNAFSIDSHPFRDDDGQWWLFYATDFLDFDDKTFRGTALVVDKLKSMTELAGHPQVVMRAHWPWQRYEAQQKSHGVVADWYTLEGPTVRKRNGRYYCFYSGGNYQNESYGVDWLEADRIGGPWREVGCERGPQLMRSIPGKVIGPGHHSLVTAPDGTDYAVYHAWNEARTDRLMCVDRLDWTDGRPTIARFKPASLHRLTPTPPRGWNSYDSFGCFINERRALENLRVFVQRLKPHGYEYFVLDAGWFRQFELAGCEFPTKDDPYRVLSDELGRPVPAPCFFPNVTPPE